MFRALQIKSEKTRQCNSYCMPQPQLIAPPRWTTTTGRRCLAKHWFTVHLNLQFHHYLDMEWHELKEWKPPRLKHGISSRSQPHSVFVVQPEAQHGLPMATAADQQRRAAETDQCRAEQAGRSALFGVVQTKICIWLPSWHIWIESSVDHSWDLNI